MAEPSELKSQVNRTRKQNDPAAFSTKPMLDEKHGAGLRGKDSQQGALRDHDRGKYRHPPEDASTRDRTPRQEFHLLRMFEAGLQ